MDKSTAKKNKTRVAIQFRASPAWAKKLSAKAASEGRSVSNYIKWVLDKDMEDKQ